MNDAKFDEVEIVLDYPIDSREKLGHIINKDRGLPVGENGSRCFRIKAEQNRDVSGPFPLVSYQIPLEPPDPARDLGDPKPFL
jgi:hypothetical protein